MFSETVVNTLAAPVSIGDAEATLAGWLELADDDRRAVVGVASNKDDKTPAAKFARSILAIVSGAVLEAASPGIVAAVEAAAAQMLLPRKPIGAEARPGFYLAGSTAEAGYLSVTMR